ncbi:hypothetical protein FHS18_006323 [Paenibacillus phyllosphaerae]|uniref:DUF4367 domain-containing protein n=1 Tax=Paenibacillus phyllosphaerae TaxID=274593 RepID=A0A7W5FR66_9BACL|nr:hypothetical protein [Paenibacillus phyllosphaerae]MBB3114205.1 hypothetical protein [Paenibacillus phyllosphaerae]
MADETKRTGGEPVFDTDRAWERFERMASHKPIPAFWQQAEDRMRSDEVRIEAQQNGNPENDKKDGAIEMTKTGANNGTLDPAVSQPETRKAIPYNAVSSVWRTETTSKRIVRRLTAGVAAVAIITGLFTTPLGDRALAAMQQTFRIHHIEGVGITADDMTSISNLLEKGSPEGDRSFNLAQYGSLSQSGGGQSLPLTWDEAAKRMGDSLLQLDNNTAPTYQPATTLTFNLNVKAVNRLLTRLGSTTTLPAEADGKEIKLYIPDGITTEGTLSGKPVRLLQFGKPELTVEDGIDPATVREAVLGLPVLPDSLRTKLATIGDWQSTLPVPARDGVTTNIQLGGHDAVMTVNGTNRYLLWLVGNRLSMLSGDTGDFQTASEFQQAAEELLLP